MFLRDIVKSCECVFSAWQQRLDSIHRSGADPNTSREQQFSYNINRVYTYSRVVTKHSTCSNLLAGLDILYIGVDEKRDSLNSTCCLKIVSCLCKLFLRGQYVGLFIEVQKWAARAGYNLSTHNLICDLPRAYMYTLHDQGHVVTFLLPQKLPFNVQNSKMGIVHFE